MTLGPCMEMDRLAEALGHTLSAKGWRLAAAESCTGGWFAKVVTDVPGSSGWFDRGFVTYSNEAKQDMLGVSVQTLMVHGAVSEATVRAMAEGAMARSLAGVSVAISGVAGPGGGSPEKPVGTVWFAWAVRGGETKAEKCHFEGEREAVRCLAVVHAMQGVIALAR